MRRFILRGLLSASLLMLAAGAAFAWDVEGNVVCEENGQAVSDVTVNITSDCGFTATTTTDVNGYYFFWLPEKPCCFEICIDDAVTPAGGCYSFCTTETTFHFERNFTIDCTEQGLCWLTGGGAKYSALTGTNLGVVKNTNKTVNASSASSTKLCNFGGNVNPGCSPTAGDGGQWNNIADDLKLHFQGFHIEVIRCGNVEGIPPGSTSPVTPFNFIEFQGTGRVKGIQGNKADYPLVYFFGRCEDRNEPGSNGQRDGAGKDRYFLNVYTDPANPTGSSIMLVDMDGNPATVDPLIITDGNLQLHISSCDSPPTTGLVASAPSAGDALLAPSTPATTDEPAALWFAAPRPSPASGNTTLRFSVPQASDVQLSVYDLMGREVAELMNGRAAAGIHTVGWDLRDGMGQPVSRGIYFLRLRVNGEVLNQRVTVMN